VDYFVTLKYEDEIIARTQCSISPMSERELAESLISQKPYGILHKQYILVIC
jgi:hypothetical protein